MALGITPKKVVDLSIEERKEFLVKWENYSSSQNTWEPEKNLLHCQA